MNRIRTEQEDNNKDFQRQLAALDTRINHLRGQERLLMNKESENNIEEQKLIEILQVTKDR